MSLSSKLSITDVDLKGKRVLIRVRPTYLPTLPLFALHYVVILPIGS